MAALKVHHIGYLVKKMDKAIASFTGLAYQISQHTLRDDIRKVDICFLVKEAIALSIFFTRYPM